MINKINFVINVGIFSKDFQPVVPPVFQGCTIGTFSQKRSLHRKLDTLSFYFFIKKKSSPCCFICPATSSADFPNPVKRSTLPGELIAPPVS